MSDQLNGLVRWKRKSIILTVYSVGFARYLIKKRLKRFGIMFADSGITISSPGNIRPRFERVKIGQPLTIFTITKITPSEVRRKLEHEKSVGFKIDIGAIIAKTELRKFQKNVVDYEFEPITENSQKQAMIKTGCFVSCFRSTKNIFCRLNFRHKIFDEIALNNYRVVFSRRPNGDFAIFQRKDGILLHYYKGKGRGSGIAYVQLPDRFVLPDEKELFEAGRRAISYKAFISAKDFNLDISKYFTDPKERELAFELLRRKILIRHPQPGLREADIVLDGTGNQIEVTKIAPIMPLQKNNAHGEGVHVNARICEGYLRVKTGKISKYYLVLDRRWLSFSWVKRLMLETCDQVRIIPTDFGCEWASGVADSIESEETT